MRSVVDFPAPFAPSKRDDLALLDVKGDPVQRLDRRRSARPRP